MGGRSSKSSGLCCMPCGKKPCGGSTACGKCPCDRAKTSEKSSNTEKLSPKNQPAPSKLSQHYNHHKWDSPRNQERTMKPTNTQQAHGHQPHAGCGLVSTKKSYIPDDYLGRDYYPDALIDTRGAKRYQDLEVFKEEYHPGFNKEKRGKLCYCIFMERDLADALLQKIQEFPTTARLSEPCTAALYRTLYRGHDVMVVKIQHSKSDRKILESCVRKLKAAGPKEFSATMTFYGRDPAKRKINKKSRKVSDSSRA